MWTLGKALNVQLLCISLWKLSSRQKHLASLRNPRCQRGPSGARAGPGSEMSPPLCHRHRGGASSGRRRRRSFCDALHGMAFAPIRVAVSEENTDIATAY